MEPKKYLTEKQLCEVLNITRPTALSMRKKGVPHYKYERMVRYDLEEVLKWLKEKQQ